MILILAEPVDVHADAVIDNLQRLGRDVIRLHFDEASTAGFRFEDEINRHVLNVRGRDIHASDVGAVLCRSVGFTDVPSETDFPRCLAASETKFWAQAFLQAVPSELWIDPLYLQDRWDNKLVQYRLASQLGLKVPKTLATNDYVRVRQFVRSNDAVIKQLSDVAFAINQRQGFGFYTTRIKEADIDGQEKAVSRCPVLLQERVNKVKDVRLTYIAGEMFGFSVVPLAQTADVDWRASADFCTSRISIPQEIEASVERVMQSTGLKYAAFDFGVTQSGEWYFFEFNVAGNWLWLEDNDCQPITEAIAKCLSKLSCGF